MPGSQQNAIRNEASASLRNVTGSDCSRGLKGDLLLSRLKPAQRWVAAQSDFKGAGYELHLLGTTASCSLALSSVMVNIVGEFMMWLRLNFAASKAGVARDYAKPAHHRSQLATATPSSPGRSRTSHSD